MVFIIQLLSRYIRPSVDLDSDELLLQNLHNAKTIFLTMIVSLTAL